MNLWAKVWDSLLKILECESEDKPARKTDEIQLLQEAHEQLDEARNLFARAEDPEMVECAIYSLTAAEKRYNYLLKRFKNKQTTGL
jgi:hypothetical protein